MLGNTNAITPNQNLSISINGVNKLTYDGTAAKSLDITLTLLGAAATSHNHDTVYAKLSHTHTKSQITDFPTTLKNPTALTISLNGTSQGAYDGSAAKAINVTAASIGAAASSHNHDSVYAKLSHTHSYLPLSGGTITGELYTSRNPVYVTPNNTGMEGTYNDTAQLDKKNNLNFSSWYGISFSSNCSGPYQNLPTVAIDCRTGNIRSHGTLYCNNIIGNGTTLSNNLNADLLDGNHASAFSLTGHNHDTVYFKKNLGGMDMDFNTILTDGRYSGYNSSKGNTPYPNTTIYGDLEVRVNGGITHNNSNNWIWQTFYKTTPTGVFFRSKTNAEAWTNWVVVAYPNSGPTCMQSTAPSDTRVAWAW